MNTATCLIENGLLLTMDPKWDAPVIESGAVLIENDTIVDCGEIDEVIFRNRNVRERVDRIIDARDHIIMPGLINAHTHLPMTMFRGLADDLPLETWLHEHIFPAEAEKLNEASVKKWAMHACREMVSGGITTCCDGYFFEDQVAEAVFESGMRGVLGHGIVDFPAPGVPDPKENVAAAVAFVKKWRGGSSSSSSAAAASHSDFASAAHSAFTVKTETVFIFGGGRYCIRPCVFTVEMDTIFPSTGVADFLPCAFTHSVAAATVSHRSSRIVPAIFCHSPYTCSETTLKRAKAAAKELGVLFQIHVAETKNEFDTIKKMGMASGSMVGNGNGQCNGGISNHGSVVRYLDALGLLDEKTLLVHSIWVDSEDIERIRKRSAKVVHCPESNMKLASGIAPVWEMIQGGVTVGLGTDGCASNNSHDLFGEMGMAAKLQKVFLEDPSVMDAKTVVKMATIDGAKAIGLDHLIGSITPGKRADIILIDRRSPHMTPIYSPWSSIVYAAKASDVRLVMVDGNILVGKG